LPEPVVDLHAHTTASDGSLRPARLVQRAAEAGLAALAVTDHDTVDGLAEAREEAGRAGIELVNGMELSVKWGDGTFHMLGYLFEEGPALDAGLAGLKGIRQERNEKMIRKLNELGFPVTTEEVVAASGGGQVGRPHMAKALVARGYFPTVDAAFATLLRKGRPAYVTVERLEPEGAIALIHEARGVAVLGHPYQLKLDAAALDAQVAGLKRAGLDGIEVQHSNHDPERQSLYESLARKYDLAGTGGSDFHGDVKPDIRLGRAWGGAPIPLSRLDDLKRRLRR